MEKAVSSIDPSSFKLLVSCPSGLSPSQVSVTFSDAYDRIPHSDPTLENSISEIWEQRSLKNKSLYNGKKFRYGGYVLHAGGGSDHEPHLCLHLGLTDYRTFVGTNLSPLWEKFLIPSEDDSIFCQHTSNPLGNGAVVETIDKKILVLQRSNNVGEFPGYFVFPGGHPEPQEIGIASHQYDKELMESINIEVSREMFDSIVREVVEEIGVPASSLSIPAFIGISRRDLNVRPTAFFSMKCSLDSQEVQQFYSKAQDGYESTQLYAVPMIELENMASRMPGCHRGGFALYKLMADTMRIT
ncbi:NUDIX hydrolase domain [Sesbania bispinosa]|nr:NUDIX hydrolase domain [Sesbania bispinosa]